MGKQSRSRARARLERGGKGRGRHAPASARVLSWTAHNLARANRVRGAFRKACDAWVRAANLERMAKNQQRRDRAFVRRLELEHGVTL